MLLSSVPAVWCGIVTTIAPRPIHTIDEARRKAVEKLLADHSKSKVLYGKKFLPGELSVGESVLYDTPWHPNRGKVAPVIEGPCIILREVSTVIFLIDRLVLPMRKTTDIVHISKLRRYLPATVLLRSYEGRGGTCDVKRKILMLVMGA